MYKYYFVFDIYLIHCFPCKIKKIMVVCHLVPTHVLHVSLVSTVKCSCHRHTVTDFSVVLIIKYLYRRISCIFILHLKFYFSVTSSQIYACYFHFLLETLALNFNYCLYQVYFQKELVDKHFHFFCASIFSVFYNND